MIKISFLILCLQAINFAICWDKFSPLILNKKGENVFFPTYVNLNPTINPPEITYKDPEEETISTYTFCRQFPAPKDGFLGQLLSVDKHRTCPIEVNSYGHLYDPVQLKGEDSEPIGCGAGVKENQVTGWQYKVHFKVQIDKKTYYQNSYDFCYDQEGMQTLYAYYDLENPSLLKNKYLIDEQNYQFALKKPTLDGPYGVDIFPHYNKQTEYKPYEVAISEFIPFGHWKISFHRWENVAAMHNTLINPWKAFIRNIKLKLAEKTEPVRVVSGIHGITRLQGKPQHLSEDKITIPMVWWVVVYNKDGSRGTAFIMHDYIPIGGLVKPEMWCKCQCGKAGLGDVVPKDYEDNTMMYCCSASDVASRVVLPSEILAQTNDLLVF